MKKIKQSINFLDKPLWFQTKKSQKNETVWADLNGYVYRTNYRLPEKMDMMVLLYVLFKSQQLGYEKKLTFTRYEIIKECGFVIDSKIYKRLEDSFERWLNVSVKFEGTFYDGKEYISIGFHILESYKIEKSGRVEIVINSDWLTEIKESNFFKYIDFNYYKALKRPVSRRLFEILCKTFKGRQEWKIGLEKLGKKLTLSGKKVNKKDGSEKEILYPSTVLSAVKPAINEINKLGQDSNLVNSIEIKESEVFCIDYELRSNNKIIVFKKRKPEWVLERNKERKEEEKTELNSLLELSKSKAKGVKAEIESCYEEYGEEYVRWNILYANQEAKKNYAAFLKKALKENWGEEHREEKQVEIKKREEENKQKKEQKKRLEQTKAKELEDEKLDKLYEFLPEKEKEKLWNEAVNYFKPLLPEGFKMPKVMIMSKVRELLREQML